MFHAASRDRKLAEVPVPHASGEGQGSTRSLPVFTSCSSPFFQAHIPQRVQIPPVVAPPSGQWIFVIDDSATMRQILETYLKHAGFQVKSFHDGVEVLRWLMEPQHWTPDLVWLDVGLPKMDGYEVLLRLKSRPEFSKTIFVLLSRRDGVMDRLKGRLAGAAAYMTKPIRLCDILLVTRSLFSLAEHEQKTLPHDGNNGEEV